jgi:hypothetical protein
VPPITPPCGDFNPPLDVKRELFVHLSVRIIAVYSLVAASYR